MKFVTDGMLGQVTRWLRLAGQDVYCINDISVSPEEEDEKLIELALKDSRIMITRDRELHEIAVNRNIDCILLKETGDVAEQLAKISRSVDNRIDIDIETSRCPVCNGELLSVEKSDLDEEVPSSVLENNTVFWRCSSCGKIYWIGGHWRKMNETIEKYERMR